MSTDIYTFRPKPEVADWIDDHVDSWTAFCYDNIYRQQRIEYQHRFDRLSIRFLILLLGMILISFSLITTSLLNYIVVLGGGICILILGFLMLFMEVKNGRKQ